MGILVYKRVGGDSSQKASINVSPQTTPERMELFTQFGEIAFLEEMDALMPQLASLGGFVRPSPMPTLEILLQFAKEKCND